jgi:RNA-directed DNA polymerase
LNVALHGLEEAAGVRYIATGANAGNLKAGSPGKLLIKPAKQAVRRFRERLAAEMRRLRGSNAMAVIATLTPLVRGWAAYYRSVVSSEVFASLDDYLWKLTYKWARHSHPNKPKTWVVDRYFGKFNKFRNGRWVFGDRDSGACLPKLAWTNIVRHIPVKAGASPDDPAWPGTGPTGGARSNPRSTGTRCGC